MGFEPVFLAVRIEVWVVGLRLSALANSATCCLRASNSPRLINPIFDTERSTSSSIFTLKASPPSLSQVFSESATSAADLFPEAKFSVNDLKVDLRSLFLLIRFSLPKYTGNPA